MIKGLADWIEANSAFVVGTTLQVGMRAQSAPDRCAVLVENAGGDTNFYTRDMMWMQVQVITRGEKASYFDARDDAYTLYNLLHGAAGIEFGTSPDIYCATVTAVNPPQSIGEDDRRRPEFSTNYRFAIYKNNGT